jgi:hypothetical protein
MADIRDFKSELTAICGFQPTQENAEELLIRGCYDVVNRFKMINPEILSTFATSATLSDANGYNLVSNNVYMVLDVQKENPSDDDNLVRCIMVNPNERGKYEDTGSLFYALDSSPVAYVLNGLLYVLPAPTADGEDVYLSLIKISDTVTNYASGVSSITGFPTSYNYFIILYASIGLLQQQISALTFPSLTISASAPTAPTLNTDASAGVGDVSLSFSASVPTYTKPTVTYDTTQFETFLETNEDSELAQLQLGRMQKELGNYQADIQNELNEFNKELSIYNAVLSNSIETLRKDLAIAIKEGELADIKTIQDNMALINKYQVEVGSYSAEVNAEVQEYSLDLKKVEEDMVQYMKLIEMLTAKYEALFVPYRSK